MNKVILRAITAYSRTDMKASSSESLAIKGRELQWSGKGYVVLEDDVTQRHVAVYRCMNRGELKRLKRWPPGLTSPIVEAPEVKAKLASNAPAILELSPIKDSNKTSLAGKLKHKSKSQASDVNQTDLFE
jgi:hypothetical protein